MIRREQTAKNTTNVFGNPNKLNVLGFKHLVDIEGVTGSIPVAHSVHDPGRIDDPSPIDGFIDAALTRMPNRRFPRRVKIGRFGGDFRRYRSALSVSGDTCGLSGRF